MNKDEPVCNPHPKAPHGFNRSASHSADRYVCDCEGWDAYDAGYQARIEDTYNRMDALDTPPAAQEEIQRLRALVRAQQITIDKLEQALAAPVQEPIALKPCWYESKEKTMCRKCGQVHAEAIPPTQPAPTQEHQINQLEKFKNHVLANADALGVVLDAPAAQRQWVGLTDKEIDHTEWIPKRGSQITYNRGWIDNMRIFARAIEAKLKEKNT